MVFKKLAACLLAVSMCGGVLPGIAPQAAEGAKQIYVAPNGSDENPGTESQPLKTFKGAKDAVREAKASSPNGIEVIFRGGEYRQDSAIVFEGADSGAKDAPVVYKSYPGEEAIITTSKEIDASKAKIVTDAEILARLPEEAQGKVASIDLHALGITDYGELQRKIYGQQLASEFEIYFNSEPLNIARWPNDTYILTGEILEDGANGIAFKCEDERIARWTQAKEALLYGFWRANWGDDSLHLASVDTQQQILKTVESPSLGLEQDRRFYIYNLLEEIDQPGEYYLDRSEGVLYFYPPADLENAQIRYSTCTDKFITASGASNITFEGLTFDGTCGDGIFMGNGENVNIVNCKLRNIGGRAVNVEYISNGEIRGNDIHNIGNAGIAVYSGNRPSLTSGNFSVTDNHIYKYARSNKTYNPAIAINSVGGYYANNLIHDAPHVAIQFGGNDNIIEYNEIYDVLQDTDDCGAIYSGRNWTVRGNKIRYNYFHDIAGPGAWSVGVYLDDTLGGTEVVGNIFRRVTAPILVGGGRDNLVTQNLIDGKTSNSSASITVDDRGFQAWYADPYNANPEGSELMLNLKAMPYQSAVWQEKYPELYNILEDDPLAPKRNTIQYNLIARHTHPNIASTIGEMGTVDSNWETSEDIGLRVDEDSKLYFEDPSILDKWPEFEIPEFDKIGLTGEGNYTIPDRTVWEELAEEESNTVVNLTTDPILIEDLIADSGNWDKGETQVQFAGTELTMGPGVIGYTGQTYTDGALRFKVKPAPEFSWLAVTMRSSESNTVPWEGANGYVLVIKSSTLEMQRWMGGTNVMLNSVSNTYIKPDEFSDVEFITCTIDDVVYSVVRINGEQVMSFADKDAFAVKKAGYITLFNGGETSEISFGKTSKEYANPENPYENGINNQVTIDDENQEEEEPEPESTYKVTVDGKDVKLTVEPIEENGRILVPYRDIFEALKMQVDWAEDTQTVTGSNDGLKIVLVIGDSEAVVNGRVYPLDCPARLSDDNTMVPVRFVAESTGADVQWNPETMTVEITTK